MSRSSVVKKHLNDKNSPEEKAIKKLYEDLIQFIHEPTIISQIINEKKSTELIKIILSKKQKSDYEIFIVKTFLKQLSNFISIIDKNNDEKKKEKVLTKISSDLSLEILPKNSFLMKVGEVGKHFFVTLSGKVTILVPKVFNVNMTENQYKSHLKFLYNNNEKFLLEKTFLSNKNLFKFEIKEIEKKDNNLIIETPLKITLEEYISKINYDNLSLNINNNFNSLISDFFQVKIYGYFNVVDLAQGSSFGEIALINENNQRTATIFTKEDSVFGVLSSNEYKNTMKKIQEKIKIENIEFIFSMKIFNPIGINLFTNNYWNYFISEKIDKGEFLFNYKERRKKIYFIQEGEIKLEIPFFNINKLIKFIKKLTNSDFNYKKLPIIKNENVTLSLCKKGDILGLEDILYDSKFICNAICISKTCTFFSIDINILKEITDLFYKIFENIKKFEKKKIELMINRLKTIKFSQEGSLENEIENEKNDMKEDINISSYFDTKGEAMKIKQAKLKKLHEELSLIKNQTSRNNNLKRLSQNYTDNKSLTTLGKRIRKFTKKISEKISFNPIQLTSSLFLKFDYENGNVIDKNNRIYKNEQLNDISYSDTNSSNSLSNESFNENENIKSKSNFKLPKINNTNNNYNTINYNNSTNKINLKNFSIKKIDVLKLPHNLKTNLVEFKPIEVPKIRIGDDAKEKMREEEIKNSMSFSEPNDIETKEFYNKIIKKNDNVTSVLKNTFHNQNLLNDKTKINKLRLFDHEMERFIDGKRNIVYQSFNNSCFKAKIIPPHFLVRGRKIKSNKKIN